MTKISDFFGKNRPKIDIFVVLVLDWSSKKIFGLGSTGGPKITLVLVLGQIFLGIFFIVLVLGRLFWPKILDIGVVLA